MKFRIKLLFVVINFFILFSTQCHDDEIILSEIIHSEDIEESYKSIHEFTQPYIVISIGSGCAVAMYARHWGLREAAFPVDWCISPFEGILHLFKNNFENYFNKENLRIGGPAHPGNVGVYDTKYDIHSRHDFLEGNDFWAQYPDIKAKYDKRVARLYKALNSNKKIYFLRSHISKAQAIILSDFFTKQFPKLDYQLVVVNDTQEFKKKWNLTRIKNYYLTQKEIGSDALAWKAIYCDLGLLKG